MRHTLFALALSFPPTLLAQSAALDAAAAAMGGKDRILAVRTLVLEGTGTQLSFGQNFTPTAETQFEVTSLRRSFDFANRRWFLDLTRVPKFVTGNMNPQRQRTGLDGDVAYNVANALPPAPGMPAPSGMTRAQPGDRAFEFVTHPVGFVQAAYGSGVNATETAEANNMRRVTITLPGGAVSMIVDGSTNLPARIERRVYQAMLGDVTFATDFSDYQDVAGIKVPMRFVQRYENLFTTGDLRLSSTHVDADVGNIAATDSIRSVILQAGGPAAPNVVVDTLAPGVWRIAGQNHHTIAIEQSNRVVLVEAPQSDARTLAVIARAREIAPAGKPVNLVVNTHHHFDHSGGFRAAVSEGLTVVTHQGNKDFYERIVYPRPHTIQRDALAQNRKPLNLMTVADRHVMQDPMRAIEIHHVAGNQHNASMLVVYLPAERILIQADMYSPPAPNAATPPAFPFVANLVENVQKRGLQVDRVVGIHGTPVPYGDLQAAAASATRAP